jgi:diacylglycerol kinase (ATP)
MKYFFVVNPLAGQEKTSTIWPNLEKLLQESGIEYDYGITASPRHATELTKQAASANYQIIVGVGGDGTLNEIVQALPGHCTLGVIPTGTGNDLAHTLGIPKNPYDALNVVLKRPQEYLMDLPLVNGRPFLNMVGVGMDAAVAKQVKDNPPKGKGMLPYLIVMLKYLFIYQGPLLKIEADDKTIQDHCILVAVGNGTRCGGGMVLCPKAITNDGFFDVCIIRELRSWERLINVPKIFSGSHLSHPKVEYFRAKKVRISGIGVPFHADGEPLGCTPLELSFNPQALKVLIPE